MPICTKKHKKEGGFGRSHQREHRQQHSVNVLHIGLPEMGLPIQPEMQHSTPFDFQRHQRSTVLTTYKIDTFEL